MDENGKVLLNRHDYTNDWKMTDLTPGLYLYSIRYQKADGHHADISGKVLVTD
jgi:hypothetical protein